MDRKWGWSSTLRLQTYVWDFFTERGFSDIQAAGIMGNIMQESSWNPLCLGVGSSFWGLFQLNEELALELESLYRDVGLDMALYGYNVSKYQAIGAEKYIPFGDLMPILETQLWFVYNKCKPTGSDWESVLRTANTTNEAAEMFLVLFEGARGSKVSENLLLYYRAGGYFQDAEKRRNHVAYYYDMFK